MFLQRIFLSRSCFTHHFFILISCKLCFGNNFGIDYYDARFSVSFLFRNVLIILRKRFHYSTRSGNTVCYIKKDFLSVKSTDGVVDTSVLWWYDRELISYASFYCEWWFVDLTFPSSLWRYDREFISYASFLRMAVRWFNISFLVVDI